MQMKPNQIEMPEKTLDQKQFEQIKLNYRKCTVYANESFKRIIETQNIILFIYTDLFI